METLRLGLAQINTIVGDLDGNQKKIIKLIAQAKKSDIDLLAFPELTMTGYPPEDLLLRPSFIDANKRALHEIIPHTKGLTAIVGYVERDHDVRNAAAVICNGEIAGIVHKSYLPNYGVFDENRYYQPASEYKVFSKENFSFGVSICEDIWSADGPVKAQALWGDAQLLVNISASPFTLGKSCARERIFATRAVDYVSVVAVCNLVGGQDELVFDGQSLIFDEQGKLVARAKQFEEELLVADIDLNRIFRNRLRDPRRRKEKSRLQGDSQQGRVQQIELPVFLTKRASAKAKTPASTQIAKRSDPTEEIYRALVLGTRDYAQKNNFEKVLIGISGGIDSALVACIAVDALGSKNVKGVFMPTHYTCKESHTDSVHLAKNLGFELISISVEEIYEKSLKALEPVFQKTKSGVAEENLQARIRANLWMALSNKFGWLVLTTGNKSELSVGYSTLYGDMAGGFNVLKDVYKTEIYDLAQYRNTLKSEIPAHSIERAPTAELRFGQTDEADLPAPYCELDRILKMYVEDDCSFEDIISAGYQEEVVRRIIAQVDRNEYKRRQSPVGVKITSRAFGRDRRMPITNRFQSS